MPDKTPTHPAKKGLGPAPALVQDIAGHHEIAGRQFLPQRPRGHPGQDLSHPQTFQGIKVGPGVEEGRREVVARLAVAGKYRKLQTLLPEEMHGPAVAIGGRIDLGLLRLQARGLEGLMRSHPGNDGDFWHKIILNLWVGAHAPRLPKNYTGEREGGGEGSY